MRATIQYAASFRRTSIAKTDRSPASLCTSGANPRIGTALSDDCPTRRASIETLRRVYRWRVIEPTHRRSLSEKELCGSLCDLCASVVKVLLSHFTTETQRSTEFAQRNSSFRQLREAKVRMRFGNP